MNNGTSQSSAVCKVHQFQRSGLFASLHFTILFHCFCAWPAPCGTSKFCAQARSYTIASSFFTCGRKTRDAPVERMEGGEGGVAGRRLMEELRTVEHGDREMGSARGGRMEDQLRRSMCRHAGGTRKRMQEHKGTLQVGVLASPSYFYASTPNRGCCCFHGHQRFKARDLLRIRGSDTRGRPTPQRGVDAGG